MLTLLRRSLIAGCIVATAAALYASLQPAGYNFMVSLIVNSANISVIVDTGNPMLTFLNSTNTRSSDVPTQCLFLTEDGSSVCFSSGICNYEPSNINDCSLVSGYVHVASASAVVNYTVAPKLTIQVPTLHSWRVSSGDIGLGYCNAIESCELTAFQQLLANASGNGFLRPPSAGSSLVPSTDSLLFGLDLNQDGHSSSMQLGDTMSIYSSELTWYQQATESPLYHVLFIDQLSVCGVDLLYGWSSNWPVLVDTGSVCLSLPSEFYNSLLSWVDFNEITDINELPTIQFSIQGSSEQFSISLSSLVVSNVSGVELLEININGVKSSLCVVSAGSVSSGTNYFNTPYISFGTLVLQNLYFAADFSSGSVGLATKVPLYPILNSSSCKAAIQCKGDQRFDYSMNSCNPPSCENFFFVQVDEVTQKCYYGNSALNWGLLILSVTILLEVVSYFTIQATAIEFLASENSPMVHRRVKFDPISAALGRAAMALMDPVVRRMFGIDGGRQRQAEE